MTDVQDGAALETSETSRLIAFSDGVVAIAITLLALDLPAPEGRSAAQLWDSLGHNARYFLAFFISFGVVAALWNAHHRIFRHINRADSTLRALNLGWLLTIVLIPFAAKLLAVSRADSTRPAHAMLFSLYAVVQMAASVTFLVMVHHADRVGLLSPNAPPDLRRRVDGQSLGMLLGFAVSIPLFFVTRYAWVLWIFGPPIAGWVARRRRKR